MANFQVVPRGSRVVVKATSSVHDTDCVWPELAGTITVDVATLPGSATQATISVDMTSFDAGDFLKNRKLRKDLAVSDYPKAIFRLEALQNASANGGHAQALAKGVIEWRGRLVEVSVDGACDVNGDTLTAKGSFSLDVTKFGVQPPRFLMLKVDPIVRVEVVLVARS